MNFLYPIYTEQTECQDCYKCIRQCPVKAIRVENGHAMVIPELCIMCGRCVINCPAKAKHVRDDLAKTQQLFSLKPRVIASLAPSFASEFPDYTLPQLIFALKKLGFWGVSETAIGADLVSAQIAKDLAQAAEKKTEQKLFISSACPSCVEFIKHFMSDYTEYITDRSSPLLGHSRFLKNTFGEDIGIVFIGPCIAKKREADVWKTIDVSLTFNDVRKWLNREGISPSSITTQESKNPVNSFIPFRAGKGAFYPIGGGMIESCRKYDPLKGVKTMAITGIEEIRSSLEGLKNDELKEPLFLEILACEGGCINGPGTARGTSLAMRNVRVTEYAQTAQDRLDDQIVNSVKDLSGTLPVNQQIKLNHTDEEIRFALRSVGKYNREDELNCASCGYDTCRAFAKAMLDNRAEKTMCVSYMRKLAQKKANGLIRAIPGGVVIANRNLKIVECNSNFASLMGSDIAEMYEAKPGLEGADLTKISPFFRFFSDVLAVNGPDVIEREVRVGKKIFHVSIFAIEKEEVAGGVIEDITAPQIQKHRIVTQAKKVIDKNLSVVQKIAFLLGENAAESESILNSIIDSFSDEKEDDA